MLSLIGERPLEEITIREITTLADVGYATFFRHYPDKSALLQEVVSGEIKKLLAMALPVLYTVDTRASAQALCAYLWNNRNLWSALLTGGAGSDVKEEFVRQAELVAPEDASDRSKLPGNLNVHFPVSGTIEILAWWLKQEPPPSVTQMAGVLDELVIRPTMERAASVQT
jgi:AcrR family transcriptional regulator